MIRMTLDTKSLRLDMIDDAESTPGMSRQQTHFRNFLMRLMQERLNKIDKNLPKEEKTNKILEVVKMPDNSWQAVGHQVKDGHIIINYDQIGDLN